MTNPRFHQMRSEPWRRCCRIKHYQGCIAGPTVTYTYVTSMEFILRPGGGPAHPDPRVGISAELNTGEQVGEQVWWLLRNGWRRRV